MLTWLLFPFFLLYLGVLLISFLGEFFWFSLLKKPYILTNAVLVLVLVGATYLYVTFPPQKPEELAPLESIGLKTEFFLENPQATLPRSLTQKEAQQALAGLESTLSLEQNLPQNSYLNLAVLAHYAGENEKASQFLEQARFSNPNNLIFVSQ